MKNKSTITNKTNFVATVLESSSFITMQVPVLFNRFVKFVTEVKSQFWTFSIETWYRCLRCTSALLNTSIVYIFEYMFFCVVFNFHLLWRKLWSNLWTRDSVDPTRLSDSKLYQQDIRFSRNSIISLDRFECTRAVINSRTRHSRFTLGISSVSDSFLQPLYWGDIFFEQSPVICSLGDITEVRNVNMCLYLAVSCDFADSQTMLYQLNPMRLVDAYMDMRQLTRSALL